MVFDQSAIGCICEAAAADGQFVVGYGVANGGASAPGCAVRAIGRCVGCACVVLELVPAEVHAAGLCCVAVGVDDEFQVPLNSFLCSYGRIGVLAPLNEVQSCIVVQQDKEAIIVGARCQRKAARICLDPRPVKACGCAARNRKQRTPEGHRAL